jgi:branched-chain amino acid transport system permease protein
VTTAVRRSPVARLRLPSRSPSPAPEPSLRLRVGLLLAAAIVLAVYPLLFTTTFAQHVGILAMTFATTAVGWNVLGGYTGQVSFGNAVFFGAGAYTTALGVRAGWSPWASIALGAVVAAVIAIAIGVPCFRLRSHYFAIATIAVGEIADVIANSNRYLGASSGLTIPLRTDGLANLQFSVLDPKPYYYVALVIFGLAAAAVWWLLRGRAGHYLRAIRDDEYAAAAAGVPVWRYKLLAVSVSAMLTAVAGGLYAMYVLFVDPSLVLDLSVSINIVLMTMLGGAGSLWGPLIGAWALEFLQEGTRHQFGSVAGLDLLIFGAVIIVVVVIEPGGIAALVRRAWRRFA